MHISITRNFSSVTRWVFGIFIENPKIRAQKEQNVDNENKTKNKKNRRKQRLRSIKDRREREREICMG